MSFKIAKQNINKPELNVLQGQRIHILLHPHSVLSLIDNLPVLSEGRIFTTGTACSENRYAQTPQIKTVTQKACVHNSPECRLYRWAIRIKRWCAVLNVRREQDIVRPPHSSTNYTRVTDHCRVLFGNLIPRRKKSGRVRLQISTLIMCTGGHMFYQWSSRHSLDK